MKHVVAAAGLVSILLLPLLSPAADAPAPATLPASTPASLPSAPSKIVAVTIYQDSALVTRQVDAPPTTGPIELLVTGLPATAVGTSLYAEGSDGVRVLSTRYRTDVQQVNVADQAATIDTKVKALSDEVSVLQNQITVDTADLAFLVKLEDFTQATLKEMTDKGAYNAQATTQTADYVMNTRAQKSVEMVQFHRKIDDDQIQINYQNQLKAQLAGTSDSTLRSAVIVIDKTAPGPGSVRLSYVVNGVSWRPEYRLHAAASPASQPAASAPASSVQLEYLAAITQQSGENWDDVDVALSTAEPLLNSAPPQLAMLDVSTGAAGANFTITLNAAPGSPPGEAANGPVPYGSSPYGTTASGSTLGNGATLSGGTLTLGSSGTSTIAASGGILREAEKASVTGNVDAANTFYNNSALIAQSAEISQQPQQSNIGGLSAQSAYQEGQSVTFHLEQTHSLPWRDDEQLMQITRLNLKPDFFYKAVPVLTPHVYRLATLVNDSKFVILPGEASVYLGSDFVGRTDLPLVVEGESFTTGFGVDPQIQVQRDLVSKTKTIQGGNQIIQFNYKVSINNFKTEPVKLQLWDRLPHSEGEAVNVTYVDADSTPVVSVDPDYVRDDKPKGLLRWDLTLTPQSTGDKAAVVKYEYKLEFDKNTDLSNFSAK